MAARIQTPLPRWLRASDAVTVVLLGLALFMAMHGGRILHVAGLRVSITSMWRVLVWAAGVAGLRHLIMPRPSLPGRLVAALPAIIRRPEPMYEDTVSGAGVVTRLSRVARRRKFLTASAVILFFAVITALMTYPQVRVLDRGVSPDIADPLLSTWRLEWIAHQLPRHPFHLFDANIFHPERNTLAYSDAMLIPALTAAPLVWLGVPPIVAYNVLLLSGFVFSAAAMVLLVWSLTRHVAASLLAGFVFAFIPFRFVHYAHLELLMTYWMPLSLWALHRTIARARLRDGLLTGACLAAQTLSSWYYGIFLATYLVPVAAALLAGCRRAHAVRAVRQLAAGGLLAAVVVGPFAVPYFKARQVVGERPLSEIEFYSATPANYLGAHARNVVFGSATARWGGQERELFQGIVVPIIAIVGLWPPLSRARVGYALALAVAFDISLGFNGWIYPWLHAHVLPYRGLRVPARMAMLVGLSLAILVGYGAARILTGAKRRGTAIALFAALVALVVWEERVQLTLTDIPSRPPGMYDRITAESDVVANVPVLAYDVTVEPYYMYFSTFHWHQMVNGYSGFLPPSYPDLAKAMERFPDERSFEALRRRGVTLIMVHGEFLKQEVYDSLVQRLDRSVDVTLDSRSLWQGRPISLYRLRPGSS